MEAAKGRGHVYLVDYLDSGNGFKIRLLLAQLGKPYRWVELDILSNETRTPGFLAKNPNGRIPRWSWMTALSSQNRMPSSGTLPRQSFHSDDRLRRAQVLQWMFFRAVQPRALRRDSSLHRETHAG